MQLARPQKAATEPLALSLAFACLLQLIDGTFLAASSPRRLERSTSPNLPNAKAIIHGHLSRKVYERVCKASKDSIDEIVACMTNNESLLSTFKDSPSASGGGGSCYKEAFGEDFDPKAVARHHELVCKRREMFETLLSCMYKRATSIADPKELENFTDGLVDAGMCIINALDS